MAKNNLFIYSDLGQVNGIPTKDPVLETMNCSLEELKKLQKKAFRSFCLRPDYLINQARKDGFLIIKTAAAILKEI